MSVSTDGILAYGIDLGEEQSIEGQELPWALVHEDGDEEGEKIYEDIEDWWIQTKYPELEDEYKKIYKDQPDIDHTLGARAYEAYDKWTKRHEEQTKAYWDKRHKAIDLLPVEQQIYCSYEYPMYILCVKGHAWSASRGYTTEISSLELDDEAVRAAEAFCETYEIPFKPKWHLASLWG